MMGIPRLRIFAGPNGSGKSTIKTVISGSLLGHYLNLDEIKKEVKNNDYFDLLGMDIKTNREEVVTFFSNHPLIDKTKLGDFVYDIQYIDKGFIDFGNIGFDSYMSAILTIF